MDEKRFCEHIIFLTHTSLYVYDKSGCREKVYVDNGEQVDILKENPEFEAFLLQKKDIASPVLYIEQEHIAYGIIAGNEKDYILGPCCTERRSLYAVHEFLERHGIHTDAHFKMGNVDILEFSEIVVMLYEMVTGKVFDRNRLMMESFGDSRLEREIGEKRYQVFHERQEDAAPHNPYRQEKWEQESIRKGDLEGFYRSIQEPYSGTLGRLATDEVRNMKNLSIVVISLACRSAINGGVIPEIAYSVADAYIRQVEDVETTGETVALTRKAEIDFCKMVQEGKKSETQNAIVIKCKELVLQYLHSKLSPKDLAEKLKVTPAYLSQLFAKEEGMTLTDYIAREKIKFAKEHLIYTEDTYGAIAYTFGFSSQSHFGSVFKKWAGMTPGEFREQYRK